MHRYIFKKASFLAIFLLFTILKLHAQTYFINDVAGTGNTGSAGDGYPAIDAELYAPWGATVDDSGNVFIADQLNGKIRKVDIKGIITTVVGTNTPIPIADSAVWRTRGNGGKADTARLSDPLEVKFDSKGNMYIADWNNRMVRRVDKKTNIITTYAGNGKVGSSLPLGDGGPAVNATLITPYDIAFDKYDNLYIADLYAFRVRKVDTNGIITTITGDGTQNFSGDNGPAVNAELRGPSSIATDTFGNIYIQDGLARIRKIDLSGIITTVAGNGGGYSGDGGLAVNAGISGVWDIAVDDSANIYLTEEFANRVRKVYASTGIIQTIAGTGSSCSCYYGNYVPALTADFYFPQGISVDKKGDVYFTDDGNNKVRVLKPCSAVTVFASDTPSLCKGSSTTLLATSGNTFTWSPATGLNKTTGAKVVATPTVTTTYTVTGTNTNCPAVPVTIVVKVDNLHTPPVIHISPSNPETCLNSPVSLTASGGTNYLWANTTGVDCRSCASIMATPEDLTTPFKVIGYSSANCFDTASISIHVDTLPNVVALPDTVPLVCPGFPVQITTTGGATYQWDANSSLSCLGCANPVARPIRSSFYIVTATNSMGCSANTYLEIDVTKGGIAGQITATKNSICPNTIDSLTTRGSVGSLQWQSSNSGTFNNIPSANDTGYSSLFSKTTNFRIIADTLGCSDTSGVFTLSIDTLPVIHFSPAQPFVCSGGGLVQITASGGNTYNWAANGNLSCTTCANPIATTTIASTYVVTAFNASLCSATDSVVVTIKSKGNPGTITSIRNPICQDTKGNLSTIGSSGQLQWQFSTSGAFSSIAGADTTFYSSILSQTTDFRIISSNGMCTDTSQTYQLVVEPLPADSFTTGISGRIVSFNSLVSQGVNNYHWDFGDDSTSTSPNPTHTYLSSKDTFYVCLTVYNGSNCSYTRCSYISFALSGIPSILSGGWKVYPVPTSDYLFINGNNTVSPIQNVEVIDMLGRTVLYKGISSNSNQIKIDVSDLTNGMYYLKVRTAIEEFVRAVVKQ